MARKNKKNILQFPKELVELAKNHRKERLAEIKSEKEKKIAKEKEKQLIEEERSKSGLKYAEKVFEWAEAFRKSSIGKELMKISYSNLFFFDDHIEQIDWVGFVVTPNGLFLNNGGRWGGIFQKQVDSATDLAKAVDTKILQTICESIENNTVWECIQRRLSDRGLTI